MVKWMLKYLSAVVCCLGLCVACTTQGGSNGKPDGNIKYISADIWRNGTNDAMLPGSFSINGSGSISFLDESMNVISIVNATSNEPQVNVDFGGLSSISGHWDIGSNAYLSIPGAYILYGSSVGESTYNVLLAQDNVTHVIASPHKWKINYTLPYTPILASIDIESNIINSSNFMYYSQDGHIYNESDQDTTIAIITPQGDRINESTLALSLNDSLVDPMVTNDFGSKTIATAMFSNGYTCMISNATPVCYNYSDFSNYLPQGVSIKSAIHLSNPDFNLVLASDGYFYGSCSGDNKDFTKIRTLGGNNQEFGVYSESGLGTWALQLFVAKNPSENGSIAVVASTRPQDIFYDLCQ